MTEEGALTAIWSEVLGKDPDPDVSFFQQGGTSLTAIIILNQYHQRQLAFSINDFYHYPTLREQIDRLLQKAGRAGRRKEGDLRWHGYAKTPQIPAYSSVHSCKRRRGAGHRGNRISGKLSGQGTGGCREEGLLPGKRRRETAV